MTYSYEPAKLQDRGRDQMRFELGDTLTEGGADSCALSNEEYDGIIAGLGPGKQAWTYAKLYALEAILLKLSYQSDTKIDVLSYGLGARAEYWKELYNDLRKQTLGKYGLPSAARSALKKLPYFHSNMEVNNRAFIEDDLLFRNITT